MWARRQREYRPAPHPDYGPAPVMARRRCLSGRPVLLGLVAGVILTGLLVQLITLANQVVNLRTEIGALATSRELLEVETAQLTAAWSRLSARAVVTARAEQELGLVVSANPDPVIVCTTVDEDDDRSLWSRAWERLGSGQSVQAAQARTDRP
jgi:hypothetical protein